MFNDAKTPLKMKKTRSACNARPTLMLNLSLAFIKEKTIIQFENSSFVFSPFKLIKSQTNLEGKKKKTTKTKNQFEFFFFFFKGKKERKNRK